MVQLKETLQVKIDRINKIGTVYVKASDLFSRSIPRAATAK